MINKKNQDIIYRNNTVGILPVQPGFPEDIYEESGPTHGASRGDGNLPDVPKHPIFGMKFVTPKL